MRIERHSPWLLAAVFALTLHCTACGGEQPAEGPPAAPVAPSTAEGSSADRAASPAAAKPDRATKKKSRATKKKSRAAKDKSKSKPSPRATTGGRVGPPKDCKEHSVPECFIRVPAGSFQMGAQATDPAAPGYDAAAQPGEAPVHQVTLGEFWIMRDEVNVRQYETCVREGGCSLEHVREGGAKYNYGRRDRMTHPLNGVSWFGAERFCKWFGARLPSEAEWEFAARGSRGARFPWGEIALCGRKERQGGGGVGNAPQTECHFDGTTSSWTTLESAENRVYAMGGNVWEWVEDWYAEDAYVAHEERGFAGPVEGERKVVRGGGWADADPLALRAAARSAMPPDFQLDDVGFRCVWSAASGGER